MFLSGDRDKIDDLKSRLSQFKEKFDRGINVQAMISVENIKRQLQAFGGCIQYNVVDQELTLVV